MRKSFKNFRKLRQEGFTLIEILVSMALFSAVVLISTSLLLFLVRASDNSHAILTAINNLDFAMEQMARTLRMGHSFYCADGIHAPTDQTQDCSFGAGKTSMSFTDAKDQRVVYKLNSGPDWGRLEREHITEGQRRVFSVTAPEIIITDLRFNVDGAPPNDGFQPRVSIRISGKTDIPGVNERDQVEFNLQTMVSSRAPSVLAMKYHSRQKGFTLLETLVALAVLMVVISSAFSMLPEGLTGARFAKNQTSASYLALEAMEVVTNLRDNAMFYSPDSSDEDNWIENLNPSECIDNDLDGDPDPNKSCLVNGIDNFLIPCDGACPPLLAYVDDFEGLIYGNGGEFDKRADAVYTNFTRVVNIERISNAIALDTSGSPGTDKVEMKVTVTVFWKDGSLTKRTVAEKILFDWMTFNK